MLERGGKLSVEVAKGQVAVRQALTGQSSLRPFLAHLPHPSSEPCPEGCH